MRMAAALLCLAAAPALAADPDPLAGGAFFGQYCAVCHGATGTGDGPMEEILTVKPADLTQLSASNGGIFPTFRVVRQIDGRRLDRVPVGTADPDLAGHRRYRGLADDHPGRHLTRTPAVKGLCDSGCGMYRARIREWRAQARPT